MSESTTTPKEVEKTIVLPKELQKDMMEFFLRTSIPRAKKLREEQQKQDEGKALLSTTSDRSDL